MISHLIGRGLYRVCVTRCASLTSVGLCSANLTRELQVPTRKCFNPLSRSRLREVSLIQAVKSLLGSRSCSTRRHKFKQTPHALKRDTVVSRPSTVQKDEVPWTKINKNPKKGRRNTASHNKEAVQNLVMLSLASTTMHKVHRYGEGQFYVPRSMCWQGAPKNGTLDMRLNGVLPHIPDLTPLHLL